jgi:hypothetical protein
MSLLLETLTDGRVGTVALATNAIAPRALLVQSRELLLQETHAHERHVKGRFGL